MEISKKSGFEQLRVFKKALDCLPEGVEKVKLRSDTAGYQHDLLKYCEKGENKRFGRIEFAIGCNVTQAFKTAVAQVPDSKWHPIYEDRGGKRMKTGSQWAEVCFVPNELCHSKNAPEYRYLAKRQIFKEQQALPGMADPQLSLPFPTMQIDTKRYKVFGIVTNIKEMNGGKYPHVLFERYADDAVCHCRTESIARQLKADLELRFGECGLELHPEKTKIFYCKDGDRKEEFSVMKFDFLGYTFRPRLSRTRWGKFFVSFTSAISNKVATAIRQKIRSWKWQLRPGDTLEDLAIEYNPMIRGWINYYGRFNSSAMLGILDHINWRLIRWATCKYKKLRGLQRKATRWLRQIAERQSNILSICAFCIKEKNKRLNDRSSMSREVHVRF